MTIRNNDDWQDLEAKAYAVEHPDLDAIETPPVPVPTVAQELAFATIRCAELQAKLTRLQGRARSAWMWLSLGESKRAQEELSRLIVDI